MGEETFPTRRALELSRQSPLWRRQARKESYQKWPEEKSEDDDDDARHLHNIWREFHSFRFYLFIVCVLGSGQHKQTPFGGMNSCLKSPRDKTLKLDGPRAADRVGGVRVVAGPLLTGRVHAMMQYPLGWTPRIGWRG